MCNGDSAEKQKKVQLLLLPGMDGTGELYRDFARLLPTWIEPQIVAYPTDQKLTYGQIRERVESVLPQSEPFAIFAESFSSPVAVLIAARAPTNLKSVVLCAGFVTSPIGGITRAFANLFSHLVFSFRAPTFAIRRYLVGNDASDEMVRSVGSAIAKVPAGALAHRLRCVLGCDYRHELRSLSVPVLYVGAVQDRLVGKRSAEVIREVRSETRFVSVDGPHLVVQARPREVMREMLDFLLRHA